MHTMQHVEEDVHAKTSGRRKRTTEERRGEEGKRCKRIRRSAKVDEQELVTIIERVLADETFHGQAAAATPIDC